MTIHSGHPFAPADDAKDAARRFRGRLASPVTLWMAGRDRDRVGLTVSSVLVGLGDPPVVVGLLDPDADLARAEPERFTVTVLTALDRGLADRFGGVAPAPGGVFAQADVADSDWGPILTGDRSWVGVRTLQRRTLGWSVELVGVIESVTLASVDPVAHVRGRYRGLAEAL
ncbi:MAG: flavin reductase [Propioniciclava sp.]